jgi:hypothetical protein
MKAFEVRKSALSKDRDQQFYLKTEIGRGKMAQGFETGGHGRIDSY